VRSLVYKKKENDYSKLNSFLKYPVTLFSTRRNEDDTFDSNGKRGEGMYTQKKSDERKVEFVNFWGTKLTSEDKNLAETAEPTQIPFVPTLDVHDGPLPPGAYVKEGKSEFDAKSTCRISIDVKTEKIDAVSTSDLVVRQLQACIDAGFDTFQLHDQTPSSLGIIKCMNENTPSYINKHWSIRLKIPPILPDVINFSTKTRLRQSVFDLIEQTGSDALDSLKIDCGNLQATNSVESEDTVIKTFEHLFELQREGWIRSIGIQDMNSQKLRNNIMSYFEDAIDFEEVEGNLLLPPFSRGLHKSKNNIRIANALADGLLTNLYYDNGRGGKSSKGFSSTPLPLLTKDHIQLLNEWTTRSELCQQSSSASIPVWKQYQENVMWQLHSIALKHDVSITAVALRWTLVDGNAALDTNGKGPIISTALADVAFNDSKDDMDDKTKEFRQVFRFQFDKEDWEILSNLSASQNDESKSNEKESQDIDFNNPALWL